MKTVYFLILSILVLALDGCSKKFRPVEPVNQVQELTETSLELSDEIPQNKLKYKDSITQAKQQYLAIPVGYKLKDYSKLGTRVQQSELFIYDGSLKTSKVIDFYKKELELSGWIYANLSTKKEGLLIADKTFKKIAISIRPIRGNSSTIHLFAQDKQSNTNLDNFVNISKVNEKDHS